MVVIQLMRAEAELNQMILEEYLEYLKSQSDSDPEAIKQVESLLNTIEEALEDAT